MADRNLLSLLGNAVVLAPTVTSSVTPVLDLGSKTRKAAIGAGGLVLGLAVSSTPAAGDDVKLQHSDAAGSGFADVPSANVNWTLSGKSKAYRRTNGIELDVEYTGAGNRILLAQYDGGKRYIRFHVGSVATGEVGAYFALLRRKYRVDDVSRS